MAAWLRQMLARNLTDCLQANEGGEPPDEEKLVEHYSSAHRKKGLFRNGPTFGAMAVLLLAGLLALLAFAVERWTRSSHSVLPGSALRVIRDDLGPSVHTLAFSPDGERLAVGGRLTRFEIGSSTITTWDARGGHKLNFPCLGTTVHSVAFSPNNRWLAVGCSKPAVVNPRIPGMPADYEAPALMLDAATGNTVLIFAVQGAVRSVAFNMDGTQLATGGTDGIVRIWDTQSGEEMLVLKQQKSWINSITFSPDGTQLATCAQSGTVQLWDLATGQPIKTFRTDSNTIGILGLTINVAFSPDGEWLTAGGFEETIPIWDVRTGQEVYSLFGHRGRVNGVAFSPDGAYLASAGSDSTVRVWDLANGKEWLTLKAHTSAVNCVAFNPLGTSIASGGEDQTIRVWCIRPVAANAND